MKKIFCTLFLILVFTVVVISATGCSSANKNNMFFKGKKTGFFTEIKETSHKSINNSRIIYLGEDNLSMPMNDLNFSIIR